MQIIIANGGIRQCQYHVRETNLSFQVFSLFFSMSRALYCTPSTPTHLSATYRLYTRVCISLNVQHLQCSNLPHSKKSVCHCHFPEMSSWHRRIQYRMFELSIRYTPMSPWHCKILRYPGISKLLRKNMVIKPRLTGCIPQDIPGSNGPLRRWETSDVSAIRWRSPMHHQRANVGVGMSAN